MELIRKLKSEIFFDWILQFLFLAVVCIAIIDFHADALYSFKYGIIWLLAYIGGKILIGVNDEKLGIRTILLSAILIITFFVFVLINWGAIAEIDASLGINIHVSLFTKVKSICEGLSACILMPYGGWNTYTLPVPCCSLLLFAREFGTIVFFMLAITLCITIKDVIVTMLINAKSISTYFIVVDTIIINVAFLIDAAAYRQRYYFIVLWIINGMIHRYVEIIRKKTK